MRDHIDRWMLGGGNHAGRQCVAILATPTMRRGNDPVELGQHLVGQIQQTAGHDVHLDAGQ